MNTVSILKQDLAPSIEYPVIFTQNVFDPANRALAEAIDRLREERVHRAMVFVDSQVAKTFPRLTRQIDHYFKAHFEDIELAANVRVISGGEELKKDIDVIKPLFSAFLRAHLCRQSFVILVGGGALLDMVGFAAALTRGGLRVIRVPTTICAQINTGLGVQCGTNFNSLKNSVGAFAPPWAVLNDWQFLPGLPEREWFGGLAEALRMSYVSDALLFDELCAQANVDQWDPENADEIRPLVERAAFLFLSQMARKNDPFEWNPAQPLEFGAWAGRQLEILSEGTLSSCEAAAIGSLLDARYAVEKGWLQNDDFEQLATAYTNIGIPLWRPELENIRPDGNPEIFEGLLDFQERRGGLLSVPFPNGIGACRFESAVDLDILECALAYLQGRGGGMVLSDAA